MEKKGYQTTEFWLSLLAMVLGAIMASGLLEVTATPLDNQIVGILVSVLSALGYTASRTFVKAKTVEVAAKAEAVKSLSQQLQANSKK